VEITKRPGGDFMDIYLKMDDSNWIYFGYTRELMQIISSDQAFNDRLKSLPEKQRKIAERRPGFTFMIASGDKLNSFMKQYQQIEAERMQSPPPTMTQGADRPIAPPPAVTQPEKKEDDAPIIEVE